MQGYFDHIPSLRDFLEVLTPSPPTTPQTTREPRVRRHLSDKAIGFVPLSRRREYGVEASLMLGGVLRACEIRADDRGLPRVWTQPTKSELRDIARMPKTEGWIQCGRLLARPKVFRKEGEAMWEGLGMFRVPEEERGLMRAARGRWSFTEVPAEMADRKLRRRVWKKLRCSGNVEREGETRVGVMGRADKPYGKFVGCMPVIPEEDESEFGKDFDFRSGRDSNGDGTGQDACGQIGKGKGEEGEGEDGQLGDSGVCFFNSFRQV